MPPVTAGLGHSLGHNWRAGGHYWGENIMSTLCPDYVWPYTWPPIDFQKLAVGGGGRGRTGRHIGPVDPLWWAGGRYWGENIMSTLCPDYVRPYPW